MNKKKAKQSYKEFGIIGLVILGILLIVSIVAIPNHFIIHNDPPVFTYEYVIAEVFSYNAKVGQTDSRPREMANQQEVYEGAIACPLKYEFGIEVLIAGDKYTCADRMNERYRDGYYFDIFMELEADSLIFGHQVLLVQILR